MTLLARYGVGAFVVVVCLVLWVVVVRRDDGPSARSVAVKIGATHCEKSGYDLKSRLDGSRQTIFDCTDFRLGARCVTMDGGIARDVTVETRLLFHGVLSSGRPGCI